MFTLGNLLCGFAAIFAASRSTGIPLAFGWTPLTFAAVYIFLGMLLDGLDGRIARLTRSHSELGEQLDSMADMVTFGVAPAFLAVQLVGVNAPFVAQFDVGDALGHRIAVVVACIYVACAALRLARFNVENGQVSKLEHGTFRGLPTPGAAGTVASLVLLHEHLKLREASPELFTSLAAAAMVAVMLLSALAMVSSFKYVHVMNRYVRNRAPFDTVVKVVVVGLLLVVWPQATLAVAFVAYALSAPVAGIYRWITGNGKRKAVGEAGS